MKGGRVTGLPLDLHHHRPRRQCTMQRTLSALILLSSLVIACSYLELFDGVQNILLHKHRKHKHKPHNADDIIGHCRRLRAKVDSEEDEFWKRSVSDRFEEGTAPVLIKNGRIWTGRKNGTQILHGDILLDKGLIKDVGSLNVASLEETFGNGRLRVVDVQGAWVTPGIVDIHTHMANAPLPLLKGAMDVESLKNIAAPWLRSLDGLNSHDESYPLSIAGGVTTELVLPGSAAVIGKLQRETRNAMLTSCDRRAGICD